ncbi:S66 family peptidase [Bacillus velezensis]|uniref:S66 family peptidase n=1 Tax=Bacillus velezensis TaxID=492670 RepID=UPI0021E52C85|nr:S66 peptidase family protein [Bacillus velezensis]MCV2523778.1 LD-carboxypeptidase [Bacillus velezensis]MEC0384315.1 LD-carboxypeptidase [Bacillus velezensis]MEC0402856.1 LD-carboxypeptidase [Bacillus velezensis]MEC3924263.1 S66 peptidase family protein [Bacillus velezensis]
MYPEKLKKGDGIRIVSPATSMSVMSDENINAAKSKLEELGFRVSFSEHAKEINEFDSSSIESRVQDLHEAFADPDIKAILTTLGGFQSNQLLRYLDYENIKRHPKILCGYSDITALGHAIYQKTGLITYSGPHFSSFAMKKGLDYTINSFLACCASDNPYEIKPSSEWSDDKWYLNQEDRRFYRNPGPLVIQPGYAEGTLIGGNLCTLNLLQGTEYFPEMEQVILFIEDDHMSDVHMFDRDLQSLIHLPAFSAVKGIVIGRFQHASNVSEEALCAVIRTKEELSSMPVIANADFGHTSPLMTFPIGGTCRIEAGSEGGRIWIDRH